MNVLLYGATGMVGQGVARECELDPGIERIVTVGRRADGPRAPKDARGRAARPHRPVVDRVGAPSDRCVLFLPRRLVARHVRGGLFQDHL